jgi:hypothetical protein
MLLLVLSVLVGVAYLAGSPPPGSVAALIPPWEITIWAAGLLLSGATGLFSAWPRTDILLSLRVELGSMLIGAGSLLLYVAAVVQYAGLSGLLAGGATAAWTVANLLRAVQIRHELRGL